MPWTRMARTCEHVGNEDPSAYKEEKGRQEMWLFHHMEAAIVNNGRM